MLEIKLANRFESLEHALLDALAVPPGSAFASHEVIVPSAGVRRRVELAAADRFGVCANVRFAFLARWLWRQIGHVVAISETSPFTTPVLAWRVHALLGETTFTASHPRLASYLAHADDTMRFELATRIAALFEHYLAYRPDWLARWLAGKLVGIAGDEAHDEPWQEALWRRIAREVGTGQRHPSIVFFEAIEAMGPEAPARAGLPSSAHVFCLPATPPLYLEVLRRLARWIDVTLYVLNPCREYWLEAIDSKRLAYLAAQGRAAHHEVGNRLLASWGKQAQAHLELLFADDAAVVDDAAFVANGDHALLARVQDAILDMTDLPPGSVALAAGDRSIEVHACHSLTRELEVLQDQLLAIFAGDDPPRPADVVVVMPDLEAGAPLVEAVFGNAPRERAIPFAITGRKASVRNPAARALLSALAVATSRLAASEVYELLRQPIVARKFGLDATALASVAAWIRASGIRWGIDGGHRAALGLPPEARHSFEDGLDRLLLGYALPSSTAAPFGERLPAGDAEGSAAIALGSFQAFVRALVELHDTLREPKLPAAWRDTLVAALDAFTLPQGDEIDDARETLAAVQELAANMEAGAIREPLACDVVREALEALLDDPARGGVPTGAVTFASMTSLRNLPYRVVCVLGLNDGAFPSLDRPAEFDLMARAPRKTDRQRRTDDRNVFLDLVLAARERLYLSYTGRSVRDNAPLRPSVLVAELLDYVGTAIAPSSEGESPAERAARLVVEHPLQPFSPEYFKRGGDPRLVSYNVEYCDALRARAIEPTAELPVPSLAEALVDEDQGADETGDELVAEPHSAFFASALPAAGAEYRELTLGQLLDFFANPCRYLLKARLAIALFDRDDTLQDDEPLIADFVARGTLARRVLPRLLAGASNVEALARAGIEYPGGPLGAAALDDELAQLRRFAAALAPELAATPLAPIDGTFECVVDGERWRVKGELADLRARGLVRWRYDNARAHDYLGGWLMHLFANAIAPAGVVARTTWQSRDGRYVLPPLDDAHRELTSLVALYRDGLDRPLHFFPKAAWCYMTEGRRIAAAASVFSSPFHPFPEIRDPSYRLALRGAPDPLDEEFVRCAITVFGRMLDVIDDVRLTAAVRNGGGR